MPYPQVIQFETRAREAEEQGRLSRERREARGATREQDGQRWLSLFRREARPALGTTPARGGGSYCRPSP